MHVLRGNKNMKIEFPTHVCLSLSAPACEMRKSRERSRVNGFDLKRFTIFHTAPKSASAHKSAIFVRCRTPLVAGSSKRMAKQQHMKIEFPMHVCLSLSAPACEVRKSLSMGSI